MVALGKTSAGRASRALWRQCVIVLDGFNAAVFESICERQLIPLVARSIAGAALGAREWRQFTAALAGPP